MIAIKNAVVPPSCYFCPMTNDGLYLCKANNPYKVLEDDCEERRPDWCPLVPVQPHGRLIDADALMHEFEKAQQTMAQHGREYSCSFMSSGQEISTEWYCVEDMLENAPTILPAEEGE